MRMPRSWANWTASAMALRYEAAFFAGNACLNEPRRFARPRNQHNEVLAL